MAPSDSTPPRDGRTSREAGSPPRRSRSACPAPGASQSSRGFLIEGSLSPGDVQRAAEAVLADPVAETFAVRPCGDGREDDGPATVVHVLPKPGVTDPEAESARAILRDLGFAVENVRTIHTYRIEGPADVAAPPGRAASWPTTPSSRPSSAPCPSIGSARGTAYHVPPRRGPDPGDGRRRADAAEQGRPAPPQPRRDADHPGPLRRARPRPDRLRARDPRPDLERALLAQDASGAGSSSRAR